MSPSKPTTCPDQTLMTQALANAVGATKRQIQFWTKHRILGYLPGTGDGQGHKRAYPRSELPFARMAWYLAGLGVRVGTINFATDCARHELNLPLHIKGAKPEWYRRALRGEVESYMVLWYHPEGGKYKPGFNWANRINLIELLPDRHGAIIINVQKMLSPYAD